MQTTCPGRHCHRSVAAFSAVLLALATSACRRSTTEQASPAKSTSPLGNGDATGFEKNRRLLESTKIEDLWRWTPDAQRKRYLVATEPDSTACSSAEALTGPCDSIDLATWCPSADRLFATPASDEFARKKNNEAALAARQTCLDKLRAAAGSLPELALVDVGLESSDYDFSHQRYLLVLSGVISDSQSNLLFATSRVACMTRDTAGNDAGLLVVRGAQNAAIGPLSALVDRCAGPEACARWAVELKKPEGEAQALKPRLRGNADSSTPRNNVDAGRSGGLRLELVIRPGSYQPFGDCQLSANSHDPAITTTRKAFVAEAVGYRVLDDEGILIDWTASGG